MGDVFGLGWIELENDVFVRGAAVLTLRATSKKEMHKAVNLLLKIALPVYFFIFTSFCFSQSAAKTPPAPKSGAPVSAAQPQAKTEKAKPEEEEVIPPAAPNAIFPAVVARINGKPILGRDLESRMRPELASMQNPKWEDLREDYRGDLTYRTITLLINSKLIYQKALSAGIQATDAEVQTEIQRISKTYKNDADMNAALAAQQMDRALLKKSLHESLTVEKYLDEMIEKKITVTSEEMAKFYAAHPDDFKHPDIVRISQIVLSAGETDAQDASAKQRAEALLARLKKGEDFAKLAKENSIDASASKGGDIGFNSKEGLNREYADAVFPLAVGDAKLMKIASNYVIFKVTDKKKEGVSTLEEVKSQLTDFLKNEKSQTEATKLINQLKDQAKIEVLIPYGKPLNP
jgi:peptidyl-prolyl cis-trans isomerase C